jgi:hypothetical protein
MSTEPSVSRPIRLAMAAIVVHFALVVGLWAVRPLEDSIPVGMDWSPTVADPPAAQRLVSQDVECNSLFDSSPRPDEPLPELTPQPEGRQPLDFQREPCELVHSQARIVFGLDVLFTIGSLTGLAWIGRRLRRRDELPVPLPTGAS